MFGNVRTLSEDTKFDGDFVCGVSRAYFRMVMEHGGDGCGDNVLRYQWNEIPME